MLLDLTQLSDEHLIGRIDGDLTLDGVFAELYRRHLRRVVVWCRNVLRDDDDAADVAQDVFLRVHRALHGFRGQSRFTTWLYVLVRRAAIDRLRRNRARTEKMAQLRLAPEETQETTLEGLSRDQDAVQLRQVLAELLTPDEEQVIYLRYSMCMTLPGINSMLDLRNASGAKALIVSALRKLRKYFAAAGQASEGH